MTPMELIPLLDSGMVEELRMYYNGHHSVVDIRNIPEVLPGYQIAKMWNSENGKGISVLLADNMAEDSDDNECKCGSCKWMGLPTRYEPCCFCGRSSNWCKFEPKFIPKAKKNSWNDILHDALERYEAMKKEENDK